MNGFMSGQPPKLLDRFAAAMRMRAWSPRTIETYCGWVRRFILFHGKRHPADLGPEVIQPFLSHLATDLNLSPLHPE